MHARKAGLRNAFVLAVSLAIILTIGQSAAAQEPLAPERLPAKTTFYLVWRGAPAASVRKANSLLALWDDPGFAPVRSAITEGILKNSEGSKSKSDLSRDEIEEYATLIENPFVVGYIGETEKNRHKRIAAKETAAAVPAWNGLFLIYDQTGKEALLAKAILRLRQEEKDPPQITSIVLAGVTAIQIRRKTETTYWATMGKFGVSASDQSVFEEIVTRLKGAAGTGASLGEVGAYREALPQLGKGAILEFFLHVPDPKEFIPDNDPAAGKFNARAAIDALHFEAVHSLCGSMVLDGGHTRITGGVLGEATEGTLFDLWPNGEAQPASLALTPADAVSYSETRVDLGGIYKTLLRVARAAAPSNQAGMVDMVDSMAQGRLGMSLSDALGLFTGEFASVQRSPDLNPEQQIFMLGIRKKPEVLKLARTILSTQIISQRDEGDVTFLKISSHASESGAGTAQWGGFHVAVTPDLVVGASRLDALRAALAQRAPGAPSGLAGQLRYQEARARFPQTLNGLSYFDMQRIDLQAVKARWLGNPKGAVPALSSHGTKPVVTPPTVSWMDRLDPQVISRHLHTMSSASWKDAKGIRFDLWIE